MNTENLPEMLFAALAVQLRAVTREQLLAAIRARKDYPRFSLAQILQQQPAIELDQSNLIQILVDEHLAACGNNAERSLSVIPLAPGLSAELSVLGLPTPAIDGAGSPPVLAGVPATKGTPNDSLQILSSSALTDLGARSQPSPEYLKRGSEAASDSCLARAQPESRPDFPHDSTPEPEATCDWHPGKGELLASRFRFLRPHAQGGVSEVSVAFDEELHREVAFKELLPERADNIAARSRLLLEGEVTASLEHPGVVPVYGMGCYRDGRPFYAMRFVRGESLREAIGHFHHQRLSANSSRYRLELRRLLAHFIAVCNTIHYAHNRGILHHDLKPENIMLGRYGETLVERFGTDATTPRQALLGKQPQGPRHC